MCTNNYTLKILNFQDKNIKLNKIEFINNTYYISVEQSKDSSLCCPQCGRTKITNNFYYIRLIKHFPINGFPTIILFKQIWFKCRYCNKTFNQPTSFINKGCNLSNQIKENILNESKYKQSFKDVSIRTNVSQTTVSNEFKKIFIAIDVIFLESFVLMSSKFLLLPENMLLLLVILNQVKYLIFFLHAYKTIFTITLTL